ncbi:MULTISPECIES: tetratricopeptide repeat protein [Stenotrophomonas]|jgi:tetratricopeptide (TPR) repeat protein|uniref:tetratricopeptide repeat protein n=1 Tax=unclassified Stenotrophomonas TaxID=196198 RepID=UPI001009F636|nr:MULTISPECIES: hypothetical protein [unclassified Stenotrophomonas]MDI9246964.1 tetratricopeptide repeat protein [Stenotrophomonas sp. RS-48]RXK65626.1 hypothetical protein ERT44_12655 [Stenotrophomonas sp. MA5]HEL3863454.1 hypothetical protein [Stenotrophomonas maltophilia]HEL4288407.1 hypothetical protein [Stenotrophomonas maltophilia]
MELPDEIYQRVTDLSEQGNVRMDAHDHAGAMRCWLQALGMLPAPAKDWEAYTWLCASLGDASLLSGDVPVGLKYFMDALNGPDGHINPFILYRIGQCNELLGKRDQALEYLLRAYALDGEDIFDADDDGSKYLALLRQQGLISP